jgi:hypothetical protein
MWLRSDKRELRNRNQPKEQFKNHRKKRKRSRNQYCKTIKLMKKEKSASVLTAKQYSTDELTLNVKKQQLPINSSNSKIFTASNKNLPYAPDSAVNQFHHTYDLNNLDIDLNGLRTSSVDDAPDENSALDDYASGASEHFQPLNTHQYDDGFADECNFDKSSSAIEAVSDMLLSKFQKISLQRKITLNCYIFSESYEERCKLASESVTFTDHHFHNHHHHEEINYGYDGSSCTKSLLATSTDHSLGGAYTEDSCNTKNLCLYKDMNYDICKTVGGVEEDDEDETEGTQEFLTQVENNNFNLSYATAVNPSDMTQYASCSNIHNVSMISSACYNNSSAITYSNTVNYHNAVYPMKDCNKNYEEVKKYILFILKLII